MSTKARILIAASPFGKACGRSLDLLEGSGHELVPNPFGRRLKAGEVQDILPGVDAVIAGTEPYKPETLAKADRLKVICRVGIGLDSVDLDYCRAHDIAVTYTPEAPAEAVAELTVCNILNLLRHVHQSDRSVREQAWNRLMGRLVRETTIGVLGAGRIGSQVIRLLAPFSPTILATDVDPAKRAQSLPNTTWVGLESLLTQVDVLTIHIPLAERNRGFISRERIAQMKTGALLINTSRGLVVDEQALTDALLQRHLGGAALDVFAEEPYSGPLTRLDNVILSAHIAASAKESRCRMELTAAEDCLRVLSGEKAQSPAPRE